MSDAVSLTMGNSPFPAGHGLARHKQLLRKRILRQPAFCPQFQKHVFGFHQYHHLIFTISHSLFLRKQLPVAPLASAENALFLFFPV